MAEEKPVIIIRKIKKSGGHGHHGGAWKVAYADFVTAMMAFFLLLWLLNATEAENLAGLADYFAPTVGVQGQMGIGFRGGKGALSSGIGADINTNKGIVFGGVPAGPVMKVTEKIELATDEPEAEKVVITINPPSVKDVPEEDRIEFAQADEKTQASEQQSETALQNAAAELSAQLEGTGAEVDIKQTPEGLQIQIRDKENRAMFEGDTAQFTRDIRPILNKIAEVISRLPNYISISGHTSSNRIERVGNYSNWELSTDRANAMRRLIINYGVQPERIYQVIGRADNEPLDPKQPESQGNERISIVLLKQGFVPEHKQSAPDQLFINSDSENVQELIQEDSTDEIEPSEEVQEEEAAPVQEELGPANPDVLKFEDPPLKEAIENNLLENVTEPTTQSLDTPAFKQDGVKTEDPFTGQGIPGLSDVDVEEKPEYQIPPKAYLLEEDKEDLGSNTQQEIQEVQDPFNSETNPLFVPEDDEVRKPSYVIPPKAYLLQEEVDTEAGTEDNTLVQDPFTDENNPLKQGF